MRYFPTLMSLLILLSLVRLQAQDIIGAEYFFNADPGPGNGTPISITQDDTLSFTAAIPTASLAMGFHRLNIRVKNQTGTWGLFASRVIMINATPVASTIISAAEFYIDVDPGVGNGISIPFGPADDTLSFAAVIPENLNPGFHTLVIRVRSQNGIWGNLSSRPFYINAAPVSMPIITQAEFFWTHDPGAGVGTAMVINPADDTLAIMPSVAVPDSFSIGQYFLAQRVRDAAGHWSHFRFDTVTIAFSMPDDTVVIATADLCSRIVNDITPVVYNNLPYTYTLMGATTGSGPGSASGLAFNIGITVVTYALTATPEVSGSFTVTVLDEQLPGITCPEDLTVNASVSTCSAIVDYTVTVTDNCPGATLMMISGIDSGGAFPIGATTNIFRATDSSGNSSTCSFTITVMDNVAPVITCPENITVQVNTVECTATSVSSGSPDVTDNCGIDTITHNAPAAFPLGLTQVIWIATDVYGNTASCVQTVTVEDNIPPVITCPPGITILGGPGDEPVLVNYNEPIVSDNCDGVSFMQTAGLPSGSLFPLGTTINVFEATDLAGNTTTCAFAVHVKLGRVGINTTEPIAMLHVSDSTVLFSGPSSLPAVPGNPPVNGAGKRLMWYPDKAAFRAGFALADQWDKPNVGVGSFASGYNTMASGYCAVAMGNQCIADDSTSVAMGNSVYATGKHAQGYGVNLNVSGESAMAFGVGSTASGTASTAMGSGTFAIGNYSTSTGAFGRAYGDASFAANYQTRANAFSSMAIGHYNDTVAASRTTWVPGDALFLIGNGSSSDRNNAWTLLKNGNLGLSTLTPQSRLHVVNSNAQAGGAAEGIRVENIHALTGEAAISFRTSAIPSNSQWSWGLNQNPILVWSYGESLTAPHTMMSLDTLGRLAIGTHIPEATLQVVRNAEIDAPVHSSSMALLESNNIGYLQMSNVNGHESGILSGNQSTTLRSAIKFNADSSMHFQSASLGSRMKISNHGHASIPGGNSDALLQSLGSSRLGVNGTTFNDIIMEETPFPIGIPQTPAGETYTTSFFFPGAQVNSIVQVSPQQSYPAGWIIGPARVISMNMVEIQFTNYNSLFSPIPMYYNIAIIQ
jgi:hypothetical protein